MSYLIRSREDLAKLKKLADSKKLLRGERLKEKLGKLDNHFDMKDVFEPMTDLKSKVIRSSTEASEKQVKAITELKKTLDHVVCMLRECSDLYLSDVNKLERGYNLLSNAFGTEPTEWELEKFAEYDIQWPPKSKTKAKGS